MDWGKVYERYLAGEHERIAEATRRLYYRLQYAQPPEDYSEPKGRPALGSARMSEGESDKTALAARVVGWLDP